MAQIDEKAFSANAAFYSRAQERRVLEGVIEYVNKRIAPAEIVEWYLLESRDAYRFEGRWAVFRVHFNVSSGLLRDTSARPAKWLATELERMMADAVQGSIRDLVRNEMKAQMDHSSETAYEKAKTMIEQTILPQTANLTARVFVLEQRQSWYRRLWRFLLRPVW